MIDTDKYEGHTPAPWRLSNGTIWGGEGDNHISLALDLEGSYQPRDVVLMTDAPLLLAEVKRLRGLLNMIVDKALHEVNTQPNGDDSPYNIILNIAYEVELR